jgi:hypothetical protein
MCFKKFFVGIFLFSQKGVKLLKFCYLSPINSYLNGN